MTWPKKGVWNSSSFNLVGGYPIFKEAVADLLARPMTMELSMTIALAAALAIGEFFTALVIVLFVLVGGFPPVFAKMATFCLRWPRLAILGNRAQVLAAAQLGSSVWRVSA